MNLNTPQIHTGPLVAADFNDEPWQLPHWMVQIEDERRQHEAAHAATDIGADDNKPRAGEGAGIALWPLAVILAIATVSFLAWALKR